MNSNLRRQLGLLLRVTRLRAELDQRELGERIGVSQPTISRWEGDGSLPALSQAEQWIAACQHGVSHELSRAALGTVRRLLAADAPESGRGLEQQLRRVLNALVSDGELVHDALIPYFADVAAGLGEQQEQRAAPRRQLSVPREVFERDPGSYALRVIGDSMAPKLIDGDIVVVSPAAPLVDGCVVAAYVEPDGDVVKIYRELPGGRVVLAPLNPAYRPINLDANGGREARIWGRVVLSQREL